MFEGSNTLQEEPIEDRWLELPQAPPLSEQDKLKGFFQRHPRLGRKLASIALIGANLAGVVSQPSLRDRAVATIASEIYYDTPLGWADQAANDYIAHEAGWDKPVETTIRTYDSPEHHPPKNAEVTNFVIPGFREMHDEEIAQQLSFATQHDYPTRYVEYGNQPVTPDSLAKLIINNLKENPIDTPEIGFTGHSMGGILALEALARAHEIAHEMGYKLPKIAFIDFLSTPAGMPTVRHAELASFFANTNIGQNAVGAIITDTLQQMEAQHFNPRDALVSGLKKVFPDIPFNTIIPGSSAQTDQPGFDARKWLFHDVRKALSDVQKGASAKLTASQLQDLNMIDSQLALHNLLWRLRHVISSDTKVYYFAPKNPTTDTVVDDPASYRSFAYTFKQIFGIDVHLITWGSGHATTRFAKDSTASEKLAYSMEPKITPKPISPVLIPGIITSPSPTQTIDVAPPPVIAAGAPKTASPEPETSTPTAPTPSPAPTPSRELAHTP